jgi:Domain of unknown function (DUF5916)/Carbohydrate family 9 binding domain-like
VQKYRNLISGTILHHDIVTFAELLLTMKRQLLILIFTLLIRQAFAQNPPIETSVSVDKVKDEIKVDGILDEATWQQADVAKDFYLSYPVDNDFPISQTEVRVAFDDDFLYFGVVCHDPTPGRYIVESLRRDWDWIKTENFSIYIDPFDDRTNGFNFSLSPYNAQREGLILNSEEVSSDWDNKWYSEVTNYEDKWVAEIAIPFKTLRYKDNLTNWNLQFLRNNVKNNERSSWTAVPQQYRTSNLAFAGKLVWLEPPPPPSVNISVIPYALGQVTKDYQEGTDYEPFGKAGFDAKVAVTSALNLDITVNPDFSQVEVDQQIVNLDRFELFFPEKRQFFLENSDLFANPGFPPSRPFFSRRIGIAQDTSGNNVQVPILFGARLSGKLNKDWRIGLLNMQTSAIKGSVLPGAENLNRGYNLPGQNYSAAVLQRQLWSRSNIGAIFVNRQATNYDATDTTNSTSAFNRIAGFDFNFANKTNTWRASVYLHGSFDPVTKKNAFAQGTFVGYQTRHWTLNYFHNYIGEGYNAEVGFVPRTGTFSIGSFRSNYIIYPKKEAIVTIKPGFRLSYTLIPNGPLADRTLGANIEFAFINTSVLTLAVNQQYTRLFRDFDPTRTGGEPLPAGTAYTWLDGTISFASDGRRAFSYSVTGQYGTYYNGTKATFISNVGYKFRPYGSFFVQAIYNDVQLPDPYNSTQFWLIGPRLDVTFTDELFLTTFVQYNEQADNVNINARFQWRFAPVSDLFIVYTDNYYPEDFSVKNRALVVKLSYWFNL